MGDKDPSLQLPQGTFLSFEDRLRNPLAEVVAARRNSQAAFYSAAFRDTRFSSGFGMYPSSYKPKPGGSIAWVLFKFGFVGGLGIFLNQYVLFLLMSLYGPSLLLLKATLSSQAAILVNFYLNQLFVFRSRNGTGTSLIRKLLLFTTVSSADLIVRLPLLWSLTNILGVWWFNANLASILLTFAGRFVISEKKIWAKN